MRDVKTMLEALGIDATRFGGIYVDAQNREKPCFNLPRDLTMTLITGYSIPLRKRVIDRLDEFERRVKEPAAMLNDPATTRGLLLSYTEKVCSRLSPRLTNSSPPRPRSTGFPRPMARCASLTRAKALQMRPKDLFDWLRRSGWIYKRAGSSHDLGYQSKTAAGLLEHKVTNVLRAGEGGCPGVEVRSFYDYHRALAPLIITNPP